MLIELRLIMLVIIVALVIFFITMLRKKKMDLKYCLVWLIALFGVALFCAFPSWLDSLSALLGIAVPVFTLFMICIAFLTCICISLTIVVSRLSDRLRKLTQNIAILECENKKEKKDTKTGSAKRNEDTA